jgi:hypothetical protein
LQNPLIYPFREHHDAQIQHLKTDIFQRFPLFAHSQHQRRIWRGKKKDKVKRRLADSEKPIGPTPPNKNPLKIEIFGGMASVLCNTTIKCWFDRMLIVDVDAEVLFL